MGISVLPVLALIFALCGYLLSPLFNLDSELGGLHWRLKALRREEGLHADS